eukprot:7112880-Ditylum_brightwellii.AAC.1
MACQIWPKGQSRPISCSCYNDSICTFCEDTDNSSDSSVLSLSSKTQPQPSNQHLNQSAQPTQSLQTKINELSKPTQLTHTVQQQHQQQQLVQQLERWCMKLYQLNVDGSWDNCGTGHIQCLFHPKEEPDTSSLPLTPAEQVLYKQFSKPMLCMHANIPNTSLLPTVS